MTTPSHPQRIVSYEDWHRASEALFDAMFDDIGIEIPELREATRKFCNCLLEDDNEMTMGDLQLLAATWQDGYTQALVDRGLTKVN